MNASKEKKILITVVLTAVMLSVLAILSAVIMCAGAFGSVEKAVGAVFEQDPKAAGLMLNALLEHKSGDGIMAAEQLGLTGRAYGLYIQGLYPAGTIAAMSAAILLAAAALTAALILYRRKEKSYQKRLRERVKGAAAGKTAFYPENDGETLYAALISEIRRTRELSDIRAEEQRLYVENVAHEIKTPTAGLLLNLDMIEESGATPERMTRARECASKIQYYIAELLKLARLRSGKMRFTREPVDISGLIDDLLRDHPDITRTGGGPVVITGDEDRLKEAIGNLLRNIDAHSGPGVSATISLERLGDEVRIRISDPGAAGVPEAERYVVGKEDGTSTGIGLSIVQETAARHFGKMLISAREGGGTDTDIILPVYDLKNSNFPESV